MSKLILKQKVKDGLNDSSARVGRYRAFDAIRPGMKRMVKQYPNLRGNLRDIKEYSIAHLPELIQQTVKQLEENGCQVYIAKDANDANKYIGNIVQDGLVVKSKSNAGKEIGISKYLENQNATVIETDLGDRINQLAKSNASHSLAPAIHIPIEKVTELFSKEVGQQLVNDENELVKVARSTLREYLENADVGISGANAIVAETGTIYLTENEGNIRAVTSMPKVHIAIAGVEKIVPKLNDAVTVIKAAASFGVGQDIGTYVSTISGPSRYSDTELDFLGNSQGPEQVHVVLLMEGRQEAIEQGFDEMLYCINCGSCLNFCPVYGEIGDKYGYKYLGGRGVAFTAFHASLEKAEEAGLSYCINCNRCVEACAVGIDTPGMLSRLRQKVVENKGLSTLKRNIFKRLAKNSLPKYIKFARTFQDLGIKRTEDKRSGNMRFNLPSFGLPKDRLIPTIPEHNFADEIKNRKKLQKPKMTVAFFAGCMVNYTKPSLGLDLLEILETENVEVLTYEDEACCGLPAITSGAATEAKELALANLKLFSKDSFDYLLFVCPSCATTIKKEWAKLLKNEAPEIQAMYQTLSQKVMDVNEFLVNKLAIQLPTNHVKAKATYHDPCHLVRGLNVKDEPRQLISSIPGIDFIEMNEADNCCGFGGSFSLAYYDLSRKINLEKVNNIQATEADYLVTSCPGCMAHIKDGIHHTGNKQKVVHVVELLAEAYRGRN